VTIDMKLHPERVSDDRLREIWDAVYEGYSECWDDAALQDMAAVGADVCSALEELFDLRAAVEAYLATPELERRYNGTEARLRATFTRAASDADP
jgi:hypothetical protein